MLTESQTFKRSLHISDLLVNSLNFCMLNTNHARSRTWKCVYCHDASISPMTATHTEHTNSNSVSLLWVHTKVLQWNPGWIKGQQHLLNTEAKGSTCRQEVSRVRVATTVQVQWSQNCDLHISEGDFVGKRDIYLLYIREIFNKPKK